MENQEVNMSYIGKFNLKQFTYTVLKDNTHNQVNLFFKNDEENIVECFSLKLNKVNKTHGKELIDKVKNYWTKLIFYTKGQPDFYQTFPIQMWDEIIVPFENGKCDFSFVMLA